MQESIAFLVRVQCRREESSRSLSHLLMSFLFYYNNNRYRVCKAPYAKAAEVLQLQYNL